MTKMALTITLIVVAFVAGTIANNLIDFMIEKMKNRKEQQ